MYVSVCVCLSPDTPLPPLRCVWWSGQRVVVCGTVSGDLLGFDMGLGKVIKTWSAHQGQNNDDDNMNTIIVNLFLTPTPLPSLLPSSFFLLLPM